MSWLPIDSAPILEWVLTYDSQSPWPSDIEETMWIALQDSHGVWVICLDGQRCDPTHWMPLPAPPEAE